jgi:hypothetical protein
MVLNGAEAGIFNDKTDFYRKYRDARQISHYPLVFHDNKREHPHIGSRRAISNPDRRVLEEKPLDACSHHSCSVIRIHPATRQRFTRGKLQTALAETGRVLHFFPGVETPLQLRYTRVDHRRGIQHFYQITSCLISEVHDILLR